MDAKRLLTLDEAELLQAHLASKVILRPSFGHHQSLRRAALLVVEDKGVRPRAAGIMVDLKSRKPLEKARLQAKSGEVFPFLPSLASFRYAPLLHELLGRFKQAPDVLIVEGAGVAHPKRFGLACHLGILADLPAFGVSSRCEHGEWEEPPPGLSGAYVFIKDAGELIGLALRPAPYKPPLFLSPGHKMDMVSGAEVLMTLLEGKRRTDVFSPVRALWRRAAPR